MTTLPSTQVRTDGLIFIRRKKIFSSLSCPDCFWPHIPPVQGVMKLVPLAQVADCSPPSRVMCKNECSYTSAAVSFCDLDRHNFTYAHFLNIISRM